MNIIDEFKNPPKDYSVLAFWFWNGELKPEKLRSQINDMVEKGIYGGFMHSRAYLKTPYLEQEWWDAVDACVDEGKKTGFYPWLYDEYAWPSGTAGSTFEYGFQKPSRTLAEGEANMAKGLYALHFPAGESDLERKGRSDEDQLLRSYEKDGDILAFYRKVYKKAVDYLNPETIARFMEYTHEEYRKRYGDEFGKQVPGIFFDEIYMMGNPIPWTDRLPQVFAEKKGYDLMEVLPSLVEGDRDEDAKVRQDYFEVITDMYEEAFFSQIADWCERYGLKFTGHTEEFLWEHPRRQGDYFKTMRHLAIPGSDNHDYRYRFPRKITYCEPKYSVSVARAYGRERCMSEAMGGAGWGCSLQEFKRGINTLAAMGTNLFIPHGFYYECDRQGSQSDWPASFFYQNPYWKYFKVFADYIRRICFLNSQGKPVVDFGLFYPIDAMRQNMVDGEENDFGHTVSNRFHQALDIMIEHQLDTDMIDKESLLRARLEDGKCVVGQQAFSVLLFPEGVDLERKLVDKLVEFREAGGKVVFYRTGVGSLPEGLEDCVLCDAGELPESVGELVTADVKVVYGGTEDLFVNHRRVGEREIYFVTSRSAGRRNVVLKLREIGNVHALDPEDGSERDTVFRVTESGTEVELELWEDQGVFLVLDRCGTGMRDEVVRERQEGCGGEIAGRSRETCCKLSAGKSQNTRVSQIEESPVMGAWEFLPLDKTYDQKWGVDAERTVLEIPVVSFTSDVSEKTELIRICNREGDLGACGRHISLWDANWITRRPSWNDQLSASDLYFRKTVELDQDVLNARFCIAAIHEFELYLNGQLVFAGESHGEPVTVDAARGWKKGENLLAIHVHNATPLDDVYVCSAEELPEDRFISLLLQGEIETDDGMVKLVSDSGWIVNDRLEDGWNCAENHAESRIAISDVLRCKNFNKGLPSGLWIPAWERGTPPLKPWGDKPLFGKLLSYPVRLFYTVAIPAGTEIIHKPEVGGEAAYTLDGKPFTWENSCIHLCPSLFVHQLGIMVLAGNERDGLRTPIRVEMVSASAPLMDWRRHGLDWFSGRCLYRNTFELEQPKGRYELDLGTVDFYCEVWANGKLAGVRVWAPYRVDVTEYLQKGTNHIAVVVANSAANERRHMLVDEGMALGWNRYWNEDNIDRESGNLAAGLCGPVTLVNKR